MRGHPQRIRPALTGAVSQWRLPGATKARRHWALGRSHKGEQMRKKLFGLAPVLIIAVFAAVPAAASAAPHWYKKNVMVGSSPVTVSTAGAFTLVTANETIKCKITDAEEIWNPSIAAAGQDLITSITFSGCKAKPLSSAAICGKGAATVVPTGLPWGSELIPGTPIRDEIRMKITVGCLAGTVPVEWGGALTPEVGNGKLVFGGPGGGFLTDPSSNTMTIAGNDALKAPPGKVTAKDP